MSLSLSKCELCKYFHEDDVENFCCDAFLEGITLEVMIANETIECSNGIRYEEV